MTQSSNIGNCVKPFIEEWDVVTITINLRENHIAGLHPDCIFTGSIFSPIARLIGITIMCDYDCNLFAIHDRIDCYSIGVLLIHVTDQSEENVHTRIVMITIMASRSLHLVLVRFGGCLSNITKESHAHATTCCVLGENSCFRSKRIRCEGIQIVGLHSHVFGNLVKTHWPAFWIWIRPIAPDFDVLLGLICEVLCWSACGISKGNERHIGRPSVTGDTTYFMVG